MSEASSERGLVDDDCGRRASGRVETNRSDERKDSKANHVHMMHRRLRQRAGMFPEADWRVGSSTVPQQRLYYQVENRVADYRGESVGPAHHSEQAQ
jgi:hypothetical protein